MPTYDAINCSPPNNEYIEIPQSVIKAFLKEDKPSDLIALYIYQQYVHKWKRPDKNIDLSKNRIKEASKILKRLGLFLEGSSL